MKEGEGEKGRRETGVSQSAVRLSIRVDLRRQKLCKRQGPTVSKVRTGSLLSNALCDYRLSGDSREYTIIRDNNDSLFLLLSLQNWDSTETIKSFVKAH